MKRKRKKTRQKRKKRVVKKLARSLNRLIEIGKKKGVLTYEELNNILPEDVVSSEKIDEILVALGDENIKIVGGPEEKLTEPEPDLGIKRELPLKEVLPHRMAHLDDPVKMYLRQMGQISLLTRQEELALA